VNDKSTVIPTTVASKTLIILAQTVTFTVTPLFVSLSYLEESFPDGRISFTVYQATDIKLWSCISYLLSFHRSGGIAFCSVGQFCATVNGQSVIRSNWKHDDIKLSGQKGLPNIWSWCCVAAGGQGTVVGVTTGYGLNSPEIECWWGLRAGPEAHPPYCTLGTGSFPVLKRPGRGADHPPPSTTNICEWIGPVHSPPLCACIDM
jgi:hypothetical protein